MGQGQAEAGRSCGQWKKGCWEMARMNGKAQKSPRAITGLPAWVQCPQDPLGCERPRMSIGIGQG